MLCSAKIAAHAKHTLNWFHYHQRSIFNMCEILLVLIKSKVTQMLFLPLWTLAVV